MEFGKRRACIEGVFSLMKKSNVKIQVSGIDYEASKNDMSEQERAKLELFMEYVGEDQSGDESWPEARDGRSIHFRFGQEVTNIERLKGGLKVTIGENGRFVKEFQAYQVVEAMGYAGEDKFSMFSNDSTLLSEEQRMQVYQAGWAQHLVIWRLRKHLQRMLSMKLNVNITWAYFMAWGKPQSIEST